MSSSPDPQPTRDPNRDSLDTLPSGDLTPGDGGVLESEGIGEGNVEADRRYRAGVKKTVESGRVEELAEEARRALEGPEGKELEEAAASTRLGHPVKRPASGGS